MKTWLRWLLVVAGVLGALCLFLWGAWQLPPVVVGTDLPGGKAGAEAKLVATAAARQDMLWIAGGILAIVTLLFTWRRDRLAQRRADLDRDANFTSRYTEAIAQLGSESVAIRLGGVYALERIARDSERDRQTILDVLAAYLRHNSPHREAALDLTVDSAAVALVLGRITRLSRPTSPVDLSGANLFGAELSRANLWGANLAGASLSGANLAGAYLGRANLSGANLIRARLRHANLVRARLPRADLTGANLSYADLEQADLHRADLTGASVVQANLTRADLTEAQLLGAQLEKPILTGVVLAGTHLEGADLSGAYLSRVLLDGAHHDKTTLWPPGFTPPPSASEL